MVRPEGLLPFAITKEASLSKFREWISHLWFRPSDLGRQSSVTAIRGVYVPFWTFDALTNSVWQAEAGYYYQVPVEVVENGRTVVRQETRIRWELVEGMLEKFFDDLPVAASRGLDRTLAESIEPFPTANLTPYDPRYLSGFIAEEYAVDLKEAFAVAKDRMQAEIHAACAERVPGDTHRNLAVTTSFSGLAYKNALLPIWIAAYQYAGRPFRFLVNGVTGKVSGKAPYSWIKIALAVLGLLALVVLLSSLKN